jgi:2-methylcitrate dehydratase PrpD
VQVTTETGDAFEKFIGVPYGDTERFISQIDIEDKFRNQALYALDPADVERAVQKIYKFEKLNDIFDLMSLLMGKPP